jgi:toxin ParE1/3/4
MAAADQDLDAQANYVASSHDPAYAARFFEAVDEALDLSARRPRLGKVIEVSSRLIPEMRILRINGFPNHLVCYQITKRGVEVLRVAHGARDYQRLFEE